MEENKSGTWTKGLSFCCLTGSGEHESRVNWVSPDPIEIGLSDLAREEPSEVVMMALKVMIAAFVL